LLFAPEAGAPFAVVAESWRMRKFTLGSFDLSLASFLDAQHTTLWLFCLALAVHWTRRYATDQHIVQRYLVAKSDAAATRAAFWSAMLCAPIFGGFMFAGACLAGFFQLAHAPLPPSADSAMPWFLVHYMPTGLLGLVVAAILAASMSTVSADLSSVGTVLTVDYYQYLFPNASDQARVWCGRVMIVLSGILIVVIGLLLLPDKDSLPLMERFVTITSILSGGTLGLFCLGFFTRTATRRGCYIGMAACVVFMAWAILTEPQEHLVDLRFNFPFNPVLIGLCSHLVLFGTGYLSSRWLGGHVPVEVDELTYWALSRKRPAVEVPVAAGGNS
jgi:SSS family solute:Na+ symporter